MRKNLRRFSNYLLYRKAAEVVTAYEKPSSQIWALLVKNYRIRILRYSQTVSQFFVVIFFCFVFIQGLYIFTDLSEFKGSLYRGFSPIDFEHYPSAIAEYHGNINMLLAYSPNNNDALNRVLQDISRTVVETVVGYASSKKMINAYHLNSTKNNILAGIDFGDDLAAKSFIPKNMTIKIKFPSELRFTQDEESTDWATNKVYKNDPQRRQPSNYYKENEGTIPSYYQEGFLALQQLITYYLIIAQKNVSTDYRDELPKIIMERFPNAPVTYIDVFKFNRFACAAGVSLAFTVACRYIIDTIASEKGSKIKDGLQIMGLRKLTNFVAMIIWAFLELLFPAIFVIFALLVIPVKVGMTVCNSSDWTVIVLVMFLTILMLISYSLFLSAVFSKEKIAGAISHLIYFLSVALYMVLYNTENFVYIITSSLIPPIAICYTVREIITLENIGRGAQWDSIWMPSSLASSYSLGISIILYIINTIILASSSLYMEEVLSKEHDAAEPWYYIFLTHSWRRRKSEMDIIRKPFEDAEDSTEIIEEPPEDLKIAVIVKDVYRIVDGRVIIRNVSFILHENQITVMLGHYGAGKSIIVSLITGMIPLSSGIIDIYGCDINNDLAKCRSFMGVHLEFSMLFEYLTVKEHIFFYCRLKGCSSMLLEREVTYFLKLTELEEKINFRPPDLTLLMKRKLSIVIAFCGNSRVVILDEPTIGLDTESKKTIWDILKKLKQDKTIMMTSHLSEEAEYIGDKIIILVNGEIKCCGTKQFLESHYQVGHYLVIYKAIGCQSNEITALLKRFVNNIRILKDDRNKIVYILPKYEFKRMQPMFKDLEKNRSNLKFISYSSSITTLEDIFLRSVASERTNFEDTDTPKYEVKKYTGFKLVRNQIYAILLKRGVIVRRYWYLYITAILIPALLMVSTFLTRRKESSIKLPAIEFNIADYKRNIILIADVTTNIYETVYRQLVKSAKGKIQNIHNIRDFYSSLMRDGKISDDEELYLLGASFEVNNNTTVPEIKLWFNNWPIHIPGLALQLALQAVYKTELGNDHNIRFLNHPFGFTLESRQKQSLKLYDTKNTGVLGIGMIICLLSLLYIHERVTNSKHLQVTSGMKLTVFWLASYLVDFVSSFFVVLAVVITIEIIRYYTVSPMELVAIFLVLMVYACTYLPIIYVESRICKNKDAGYFSLLFLLCVTFIGIIPLLQMISFKHPKSTRALELISMLFFHPYAAYRAMQKIFTASDVYTHCVAMVDKCTASLGDEAMCKEIMCARVEMCCYTKSTYFNIPEHSVLWHILCMGIHATTWWLILFSLEFRFLSFNLHLPFHKKTTDELQIHEDVKLERSKITDLGRVETERQYAVILKGISKRTCCFRPCFALKRVFLAIKRRECFCLLGLKGAGKTTLFNILTGRKRPSEGKAWVLGYQVPRKISKIRKRIGYCPEFEAYPNFMTVEEILMMYCLIKGIPAKDCQSATKKISEEFSISQYLTKKTKKLNGSVRRKLSVAIALIAEPEILILDEPTAALDSKTKHLIWQRILEAHACGTCVILATTDLEECETLSTRTALMVNGKFICIGSIQEMRNKYSQEGSLKVKLYTEADIERMKFHLMQNFQNCRLLEAERTHLIFVLSDEMPWSQKLFKLEQLKTKLLIQEYSLSQSSLEHVFLALMRKQNPTIKEFL